MSRRTWNRMNEPDGFDSWRAGDKSTPLIDSDGNVAMYYAGRIRVRDAHGFWETLGYQQIYQSSYFYWLVLSESNRDWKSDAVLDWALGNMLMPQDVIEEAKTRPVEAQARLQHTAWAQAIKSRDGACVVTGSTYALEACHVKPFAVCTVAEARDLDNGVTLTASVHSLLDSGIRDLNPADPLTSIVKVDAWTELCRRVDEAVA
ncbi:HNH endonuclease [Enterobacter hormaechei]|uniref:HNH endonuclease signature motif containing protein n=1 Tax=Enterobacter hormaechei TaxID=158836 RepID=UPI00109D247D|nr:HNH endonuclease signature motif containing protein [Enterobacter hormaechei]THA90239.1 HNH endonuclease [Enterobacter hormaechei]